MRIYVDMDGVLVDFPTALDKRGLSRDTKDPELIPGLFAEMDPIPGALEAYRKLVKRGHDVYLLSTAPWMNETAWGDKCGWVKKHLGDVAKKRLILSHHKHLLRGDILVDDRKKRGAGAFHGIHIRYGAEDFPDWVSVLKEIEELT